MAAARALFALLIAVSLTFAPLSAARAMYAVNASHGMAMAQSHTPDCHKADHHHRHHHEAPARHDCCGGGDGSKAKCPDGGCGCIFKCGAQTLAVFAVQEPFPLTSAGEFHAPVAAQPPGLRHVPPGPPPRV